MKRKGLLYLLLIIIMLLVTTPVFADSGWGISYGGGSSSSFGGGVDLIRLVVYIFVGTIDAIFAVITIVMRKKEIKRFTKLKNEKNKSDVVLNLDYNGDSDLGLDFSPYIGDGDSKIQEFFPDLNEYLLIKKLVNIFVDIQEAWMLFDYESLKKLCSEELYHSYKSDLEVKKKKKEQNIMDDFKLKACNVKDIREENGFIVIELFIHLTFRDYVINSDTGDVVRGDFNSRKHGQYDLEYIVSNNNNKDIICPNCGSKINKGISECNYCHSVINNNYSDIVLSKKSEI